MTSHQSLNLQRAVASAYRLAILYLGIATVAQVYDNGDRLNPEDDEHRLLEVIEGARDAWRPFWRRGSNRKLEPSSSSNE